MKVGVICRHNKPLLLLLYSLVFLFPWKFSQSYKHNVGLWLILFGSTFNLDYEKLHGFNPVFPLTLSAPAPQNGQTYLNNLSAKTDELFWVCLTTLSKGLKG